MTEATGSAVIGTTKPEYPAETDASAVDGRVEDVVDGHVSGWAWNPSRGEERLTVRVLIDGEEVAGGFADLPRPSLVAAGIGDGAHGFRVPLPARLGHRPSSAHELAVLAGPTGVALAAARAFQVSVSSAEHPFTGTRFVPAAADGEVASAPVGPAIGAHLAMGLARAGRSIAGVLGRIPVRVRRRSGFALFLVALVALTWPLEAAGVIPGTGIDPSWQIGLNLAVAHGLVFGRQLIFTYGPLGFALSPMAVTPGTLSAALMITFVVQLVLVAILYRCLRRTFGPVSGTVLAVAGATLVSLTTADTEVAIVFGAASLALTAKPSRSERAALLLAVGGGALVAFTILVKLNGGITAAAIVAVALAAGERPRHFLAIAAASASAALVLMWLAAGQPLGALPDYLRNGWEVVRGYVDAMGEPAVGGMAELQRLVLFGSAAVLAAYAWMGSWTLSRRRRAALVIAVLLVHYLMFREVFTAWEVSRGYFYALLAGVALMVPWPVGRRATGIAIASVLAVMALTSHPISLTRVIDPLDRARQFEADVRLAFSSGEQDRLISTARKAALSGLTDPVPAPVLAAVRNRCVTVEPSQISVVWLYGLRWCPLPALQAYNAYTARLDLLDAAAYSDARRGPSAVLRQPGPSFIARNPSWGSPAAMVAMLCHFREVVSGGGWQALVRVADRCGTPVALSTIQAPLLGRTVPVPLAPAGDLLIAKIDGLGGDPG